MFDAHAKAEGPHARHVVDAAPDLLHDEASPDVVPRQEIGQPSDIVATPAAPRDAAQVEAVVNAVVAKRHEAMLVDGIPKPQLGGDAAVK